MTTIEVLYTARQPISHGAFDHGDGNVMGFHHMDALVPDASPIPHMDGPLVRRRIPAVSANSQRGILRRILARDVLDLAGWTMETPGWDMVYGTLANGGSLGSQAVRKVPAEVRAWRDALPMLSVLGASVQHGMIPGRLCPGAAWLVCTESLRGGYVPSSSALDPMPAVDLMTEVSFVRMPDATEHDMSALGYTPMPVTVQAIVPGARLHAVHKVTGSSLEASAIAWALDRLSRLGGKSGAGFGDVDVQHTGDASEYAAWRDAASGLGDRLTDFAAWLGEGAGSKKKGR